MTSVTRSDGTVSSVALPQESQSKIRRPNVDGFVLPCRGTSQGSERGLLRPANRVYRSPTQPL